MADNKKVGYSQSQRNKNKISD